MIHVESLTKKFGQQTVFENLNLNIPLNKTTVLSGPSGSGKTTLLRIMAGLDRNYSGNISGVPSAVSFMFQEDRLLPWRSVKGNIEFVLSSVINESETGSAISQILEYVQLTGHEDKFPSSLSGGMKRRAALARALCFPYELLILDEPFNGLDSQLKDDIIVLFKKLFVDTEKTAIIVTHDREVIQKLECNEIDLAEYNYLAPKTVL
jgi:NitT/TauT family transport system ATP-binding protein